MTGAGAPGAPGILESLQLVTERQVTVIGADMNPHASCASMVDEFKTIPPASNPDFIPVLSEFAAQKKANAILPLVTCELPILSRERETFAQYGCQAVVANENVIAVSGDKGRMLTALEEKGVPVPRSRSVTSVEELRAAADYLGHPSAPVVVKPCVSNGSRGMRILDRSVDRLKLLLKNKPTSAYSNLDEICGVLEGADPFPDYLVMEYLPHQEYSVDILAKDGDALVIVPRQRDRVRGGISIEATAVCDTDVIDYSKVVTKTLGLDGVVGIQVILDSDDLPKIIEVNPRVQGTIVLSTAAGVNMPYLAIKQALGEPFDIPEIRWGTKMVRRFTESFTSDDGRSGMLGDFAQLGPI
jgi:carbamoyl-phosphate synthase large subunit